MHVHEPSLRPLPSRPRARRAGAQGGFTLLEVVAAFAILALGLGLAMRAATGSMQQSRQAAEHTRAALHARSVFDTLGVGEPLQEGQYRGEFEDGFRWSAQVTPYQPGEGEPEGFDPAQAMVRLVRIDLDIEWERDGRPARAHFASLRAMQPEQP